MDVQMPVMDGYEATRRIRSELGLTLPVIAMTANAMVGDREKSLHCGMNDHVAKPIDPQHLFRTLMRWLVPGRSSGGEEALPYPLEKVVVNEPLPGLPGLDWTLALQRCAGNRELLERLLRRFAVDQAEVLASIEEKWRRGEREEAIRLAHTLKGLAGSIGAEPLREATFHLEQALTEGCEILHPLFEGVKGHLVPLLTALSCLPEVASSACEVPTGGVSELTGLLHSLQEPLQARQPKACHPLVERLEAKEWPPEWRVRVNQLVKTIRKYRFKEASQELNELLRAAADP
ncbi:MAG: response regulator, partial [Magnetococcales bacterium]|nr:response regulator [Magnetococcales bacterium]